MKKLALWAVIMIIAICCGCAVAEESAEDAQVRFEEGCSYYFQATECVAKVPTVDNYRVLQGGGTDGKYAYYAMADNINKAIIYKYDMETWECIASSEPLKLGHANDITYDPEENKLIVAFTNNTKLCYVDPDTLTSIDNEYITVYPHRLQYIPQTKQMLIGSSYMLLFFEKGDYKTAKSSFTCQGNRFTTQGLTCDGSYVYDVRWDDEQYKASLIDQSIVCDWIVVHDVQGKYIGDLPIYGLEGEPENIIWLGGNRFVIGCNGSDSVYLTELRQEA